MKNSIFILCLLFNLIASSAFGSNQSTEGTLDSSRLKSLTSIGASLKDDFIIEIPVTPNNVNEMRGVIEAEQDILNFYNPIIIIQCPLSDSLNDIINALPKLYGLRMTRDTLSTKEAEFVAHIISSHSHDLRELELSGVALWKRWNPDYNLDKYPKHHSTLDVTYLINNSNFLPISIALKSLVGIEKLSLSTVDFYTNANRENSTEFWSILDGFSELKFLDLQYIQGWPPSVNEVLPNLKQVEELYLGGELMDISGSDNFSTVRKLHLRLEKYSTADKGLLKVLGNKPNLTELDVSVDLQSTGKGALTGEFLDLLNEAPLIKLNLSNHRIISSHLRGLHFAEMASRLTYLNLNRNKLDDEAISHIIIALGNLKFLDVSYNKVTIAGFKHIEKITPTLEMIRVKGNNLNHQDRFQLIERLEDSHQNLQVVTFNTEQIANDPIVRFILLGAHKDPIVDVSELSEERFPGDAGARLMVPHIKDNKQLKGLRLEGFTPAGTTPVLKALQTAPNFTFLELTSNDKQQICDSNPELFTNLRLTSLAFKKNAMPWGQLPCLPTLTSLEISHNKDYGDQRSESLWRTLQYGLPQLKTLEKLDLSHNDLSIRNFVYTYPSKYAPKDVSSPAKEVIKYLLGPDHNITKLNLSYNHLGEDISELLAKGDVGCSLRTLDISHNAKGRNNFPHRALPTFLKIEHHITSLTSDHNLIWNWNWKSCCGGVFDTFDAISKNKTLKHLGIPDSGLGASFDDSWGSSSDTYAARNAFCKALEGSNITSLDLSTTPYADIEGSNNTFYNRSACLQRLFPGLPRQIKYVVFSGEAFHFQSYWLSLFLARGNALFRYHENEEEVRKRIKNALHDISALQIEPVKLYKG